MPTLYEAIRERAIEIAKEYERQLSETQIGNIYSRIPQLITDLTKAQLFDSDRIEKAHYDRPTNNR